jgi:hypothetical protein
MASLRFLNIDAKTANSGIIFSVYLGRVLEAIERKAGEENIYTAINSSLVSDSECRSVQNPIVHNERWAGCPRTLAEPETRRIP